MNRVSQSAMKMGFHIHAFAFVITMILLVAINLYKGSPYWVLWVLLGWGAGLLSHWWFTLAPWAVRREIN